MKELIFLMLLLAFQCEAQLKNSINVFNVQIDYTRSADGKTTDFVLTSNIGNINPASAWLGVGFNSIVGMVRLILNITFKLQ